MRERSRLWPLTAGVQRLRAKYERWVLRAGQLLIVDEASMAGTFHLDALTAQATAASAKVLLVGDHAQLSAVDAGGAFDLLAERGDPSTLRSLWRFSHQWEAAATRLLRVGHIRALDAYEEHERILAGPGEVMLEDAYANWCDSGTSGATAILLAADRLTVDALNDRAHADRVADRAVAATGITTPTGTTIGAGDRVLTRQNARHLHVATGGHVRNGDLWNVIATHRWRTLLPTCGLTQDQVTSIWSPDGDLAAALVKDLTTFLDAGRETRDAHEVDRVGPLEPVDAADPAAAPLQQIDDLMTLRIQALTNLAIATRPDWMRPLGGEPDPGPAHWTARLAAQVARRDLNQLTDPDELAARTTALPLAIATPPNRPYRPEGRSIHR